MTVESMVMSGRESLEFRRWLNEHIGVDFEITEIEDDTYNTTIFDITDQELIKIKAYENIIKEKRT